MSRHKVDKLNNFYIRSMFLVVMRNDRARTTIAVGKKETSQINKVEERSWNVQVLDLVRARESHRSWRMQFRCKIMIHLIQ